MLRRLARRIRSDEGFTLVELLVTLSILSIIIVPLAQLVISYLINSATVRARLIESKDQQIASQFWSSDVDSLGQRNTTSFAASSGINAGPTCGTLPAGGTLQISFQWTTFSFTPPSTTTTPSTTTVTYYSTPSTATTSGKLIRTSCASGSPLSVTVANTVDTSQPITCSTDGSTWSICSTVSGGGGTGVYLKFYSKDPSGKGQPYWTILRGQRRQTL